MSIDIGCPYAPWRMPHTTTYDVSNPDVGVLVDALRRIAEEPLTGPEKAAIAWKALKG